MRVFYDHQVFDSQRIGGISRYFAELMSGADVFFDTVLGVKSTENQYLLESALLRERFALSAYTPLFPSLPNSIPGLVSLRREWTRCQSRAGKLKNKQYSHALLQQSNFDIYHPTYYDAVDFLPHLHGKPMVLTVYDMIHELFPEMMYKSDATASHKCLMVQHAKRIIAISKSTKRDLMRILQVPESRIDVIYLGSSMKRCEHLENAPKLPSRYILFTGARGGYKNFFHLLSAIADILREESDLFLVCTGAAFSESERAQLQSLGIHQKVVHLFADEAVLSYLYSHATLFVFPSQYEGFGIPILEAFRCGCPAVLSQTSSLPEVGGDAAVYIDPHNAESMRQVIRQTLHDSEQRRHLAALGSQRATLFTWKKAVAATAETYRRALALVPADAPLTPHASLQPQE